MERQAVTSSNIKSIGFEAAKPPFGGLTYEVGTVECEFMNGSIYTYGFVPRSVFEGVMNAPSTGAAFNIAIKKAYTGVKVQDARARECTPVTEQLTGAAAYHAHLDVCTQCRDHPMEQCPVGQALLVASVRS